jgi:hypothetical protein
MHWSAPRLDSKEQFAASADVDAGGGRVYDLTQTQSQDQIHKFLDSPQQTHINYFFAPRFPEPSPYQLAPILYTKLLSVKKSVLTHKTHIPRSKPTPYRFEVLSRHDILSSLNICNTRIDSQVRDIPFSSMIES